MEFVKTKKTEMFGLKATAEGPSSPLISKALGTSIKHLTIDEFMKVIEFEEDDIMTDYFWQVMVEKRCIHLTTPLMKCLGYEGEIRSQQQAMKRFLKNNGVNLLELDSFDPAIKQYPTIEEEMKKMANKGSIAKRKWLIVEPREFKKIVMKLNTKNGDKIREYYIHIEEFIKLYLEYSIYFKERESQIAKKQSDQKIDSLEQLIIQMKIDSETRERAAEERHSQVIDLAEETNEQLNNLTDLVEDHNELLPDKFMDVLKPLTENLVISPQENSLKARFIVLALGNGQYRIARGQTRNVSRVKADYPNAKILLDLPLVGAQDRMTEVRKQVRNKIKLKQFGDATFKASLVVNLDKQFEIGFLQSILDVHEKFQSIPVDIIKQAREELSITN